jgi:hypothetical protein
LFGAQFQGFEHPDPLLACAGNHIP